MTGKIRSIGGGPPGGTGPAVVPRDFEAAWQGVVTDAIDIYKATPEGAQTGDPLPPYDPAIPNGPKGTDLVAVRTRFIAVINTDFPTPTPGGTITYQWSIGGSHIKDYTHDVDEAAGHTVTNFAANDATLKNALVNFFWTNQAGVMVGEPPTRSTPAFLTVTATATGHEPISKTVALEVTHTSDPNFDVYTVDGDEDRTPGYAILQSHMNWHRGFNVDVAPEATTGGEVPVFSGPAPPNAPPGWGDVAMDVFLVDRRPDRRAMFYNGAAFLRWHRAFIDSHLTWRATFNLPKYLGPDPPPGTPATPQYLLREPTTSSSADSRVYDYVRLGEYQNLDQLGGDVVHPWHNGGHGAIAAATGFARMSNTTSPGAEQDTFWKWHTIVDKPRSDWAIDQASVVAVTPSANSTVTTRPTAITITFDKKVSSGAGAYDTANTIRIKFGALTVNGSPATAMADTRPTNPFTQYRFTGFAAPAAGPITVVLTGTASYAGQNYTFTYQP